MSEVEFELRKLGDLIEIYNNKRVPLSAKQREGLEKIYPYYGAQGIVDYVDDYIFDGKYILIAEDGENLKSNNKSICTLATGKYWVNNHAHIIEGNDETNTDFLYYKLNSISFAPYITGSAQPKLNKENLLNIELYIPSREHQDKIAKVLTLLDQKIQTNNQINQELEAMAKTLYDYWFVQFDFPDQNGKPYKSSGGKMVYNSELKREIPEGWGVEKLEKIANITMGQSPKGTSYNEVGEGMLFFQGSTDFGWRFPVARQYTTEPSRIAEEDDILLSVRAPVGTLNIADTRCCIGRGLAAINSKVGANSYIFNVMQDFKKLFDMINSVGTTFGSITKDDLYSLQLVYPPTELLMEFDQLVKSFDREIKNRSRQNQELNQLRDWLLPMLMNGQVKVE